MCVISTLHISHKFAKIGVRRFSLSLSLPLSHFGTFSKLWKFVAVVVVVVVVVVDTHMCV